MIYEVALLLFKWSLRYRMFSPSPQQQCKETVYGNIGILKVVTEYEADESISDPAGIDTAHLLFSGPVNLNATPTALL
jgi:hypothetical protein